MRYLIDLKEARLIELTQTIFTIGSDKDCDLEIEGVHPLLAHIYTDRGRVILRTKNRGKIRLNGSKFLEKELNSGDIIEIGNNRFVYLDRLNLTNENNQIAIDAFNSLHKFCRDLINERSINRLFDRIVTQLVKLTSSDRGMLVFDDGGVFKIVSIYPDKKISEEEKKPYSDTILDLVIKSKRSIIFEDVESDRKISKTDSVLRLRLRSVMAIPMQLGNRVSGLLYLGSSGKKGIFLEEHKRLAEIYAAFAALMVENARFMKGLEQRLESLKSDFDAVTYGQLLGQSHKMKRIYQIIDKVSDTDVTVLIEGETGTGKELVARELHKRSRRRNGPFVAVNCGAIPNNLLESELFGHKKGAFTGAYFDNPGRFKMADGGTVFLDEIAELPLELQVKLLRVIQEREVLPVGATEPIKVDIRIIAATNKDLEKETKEGRFREDLFYRLNIINIKMPSLRERGADILLLANYFIKKYTKELVTGEKRLTQGARRALLNYSWPGNVRELQNRINKAIILSETDLITPEDLGLEDPGELSMIKPLKEAKSEFAREYVKEVLELNNGNRTKTAKDLGVDVRTIFRILKEDRDA